MHSNFRIAILSILEGMEEEEEEAGDLRMGRISSTTTTDVRSR